MKKIGIILRSFEENAKIFMGTRLDMFTCLNNEDVILLGIPVILDFPKIKELINMCEGIIMPGGEQINKNDWLIVDYLYKNNIPTLGICLGMQIMGQYFNGYQEIKVDNHYSYEQYKHEIDIKEDSKLFKIIKHKKIKVNSRHNFALVKNNLDVSAMSEDGVIEAIEDKNKKFFIGLEWHPESIDDDNSKSIWQAFINSLD